MFERPAPDRTQEGFATVQLGQLFALRKEPGRAGLPVMSVTMERGLVARDSLERRVETDLRPEEHLLARKGDIAYNMMRMWQGASGLAKEDCLLSPAYVVLRPLRELCSEFAAHLFKAPETIAMFHRFSQGITGDRLRLYFRDFQQIHVTMPAATEVQRRIAEVLDAAEADILAIEAVIAKLRQMKAGLLRDLLTHGLDEQGRLRDPAAHPEQFKDSPIDRVPRHWEVIPFSDTVASWAVAPRFPGDLYNLHGSVATLRTTDLDEEGEIDLATMPLADLSVEGFRGHLLHPGDLVVSRSGTCGLAAVFPGYRLPVLPGAFLLRFRLNDRLQPLFARFCFNNGPLAQAVQGEAEGAVQKNIRGTSVLPLLIALPPVPEQEAILLRVSALETPIRAEEAYRDKLKLQKRGLMNDLLTGRVRA